MMPSSDQSHTNDMNNNDNINNNINNNNMDSNPISNKNTNVQVNSSWVTNISGQIIDFLICPICLELITQPVQCSGCGRLFCQTDYYNCRLQVHNSCPICKNSPFTKKQSMHITNKALYQLLKLRCMVCPQQLQSKQPAHIQQYSYKDLIRHLSQQHHKNFPILTKPPQEQYVLQLDPQFHHPHTSTKIQLSKYQNIELLYNKNKKNQHYNINYLQILDSRFRMIQIDFNKMRFDTNMVYGKISITKSNRIFGNQPYIVWVFQNQHNTEQFYLEEQQAVIEQNYQKFLVDKALNYAKVAVNGGKLVYQLDFIRMKQINVYSKFQRNIKRIRIKLDD